MMNVYSLLCWRKSWPSQCKRTRSIQACKNRVLGVVWSVQSDEFRFTVSLATKPRTRRGLLSAMNSLFDSLGLVAPVVLEAFYLSQLVRTGVGMGWGDAREGFAQVGKVAVKSAPAGQHVISSLFQFELVWRYAEMSVARFCWCFNNRLWCRVLPASCFFVWYGGLLLALYNCSSLAAPGLSLYNSWFVLSSGCVPCRSSAHRGPGKKAAVPLYKVLVKPGQESW